MMNNTKLEKGGIDTVIAYIVVAIPLTYLLIFIIGIIYHFSIQSYVSQVAKELAVTVGTHGKLTSDMLNRAKARLDNLDVDSDPDTTNDFQIAMKVKRYDENNNKFSSDPYGYTDLLLAETDLDLKKKDIIEIYLQSKETSMLASIANFSIFGSGGTVSELRYSSFREEIVRNDPSS